MTAKSKALPILFKTAQAKKALSRSIIAIALTAAGCFSRGADRELDTVASLGVPDSWKLPPLSKDFASHWHDGQAEVAAYRLSIARYNETRHGHAVAIFVTEPFSVSRRVKIEDSQLANSPQGDAVEVMKLNLVRDFATGLYDYNTMASAFVTTAPSAAGPQGSPLKATFSAQEWCGHVYESMVPRGKKLVHEVRSYFGNEGDRNHVLTAGDGAVLVDALFHWARGWAPPVLAPGSAVQVSLLDSLIELRFGHGSAHFVPAMMSVAAETESLSAAGRTWTVRRKEVKSSDGRHYQFWIDEERPHIVIKWEFAGAAGADETALLLGSARYKYWDMKDEASRTRLTELGLDPSRW